MFKNVGNEVKNWAKFLVVLMTIPSVLVGIGFWSFFATMLDQGFLGFVIGVIIAAIGYFFARLGYILLYAYGELVDCTSMIHANFEACIEEYNKQQVSLEESSLEKIPTWKRVEMERAAKEAAEKKDSE